MGSCGSKDSTKVQTLPEKTANGTSNGHATATVAVILYLALFVHKTRTLQFYSFVFVCSFSMKLQYMYAYNGFVSVLESENYYIRRHGSHRLPEEEAGLHLPGILW